LAERLEADNIFSIKPDHIIINKYKQNGNRIWSIPPHIDSPHFFGDIIASLTLGNLCIVEFYKAHHDSDQLILVKKVLPKSLYVMTDESRYVYYHRIPDRRYNEKRSLEEKSNTRISLSFRNLVKLEQKR